ncbi:MAG: allophanate hydrolase subunit 1 [Proteobacteria bacterium]|nr:allophanate hydrolase subunit 1 [Pseudomonadota bacterium]
MNTGVVELAAPRVSLCGDAALLLDAEGSLSLPTQQRIWTLSEEVLQWPEVVDTQPGMNSLLVVLDPIKSDPEGVATRLLDAWLRTDSGRPAGRLLEVGVVYGGEWGMDLPEVARILGMTIESVAQLHASTEYTVFAPGVGPGYGYLFGLDPKLFTPRRQVPVMRPADSSIAIGGAQSNLRGPRMPKKPDMVATGWYSVGRATDVPVPFDFSRQPPNLLSLGDRIRFRIERIDA